MAALKVMEKKTQKAGVAAQLDDGRYRVTFEDNTSKDLAESTFKRLYRVEGEVEAAASLEQVEETVEQTEEVPQAEEKQDQGVFHETEEIHPGNDDEVTGGEGEQQEDDNNEEENAAPQEAVEEVTTEQAAQEAVEQENKEAEFPLAELDSLLNGAQELPEIKEEIVEDEKPKPTPAPQPVGRTVADLGLNIELLDWTMSGTRGGKTDKVTSVISIQEYKMEITEYAGYITDVRLFKENPDAPENDPDAAWELAYKSLKMSLKDTLEWLGLDADDMKIARKEITAIRKAVKQAHLEQLEEQKELESLEMQETNA